MNLRKIICAFEGHTPDFRRFENTGERFLYCSRCGEKMSEVNVEMIKLSKTETEGKCDYPGCTNPSNYAPFKITKDKWLCLCEEHYNLWRFIDNLLFYAKIEINLRQSRFAEK